MKVLTIKEPFATLIKNKVKYIETRAGKLIIEENYIFKLDLLN